MYKIYQQLLDQKGIKNADVARGANVSNMILSDWKNGKTTPNANSFQKIANFLDVSVDYLMTGKEPEFSIEMAKTDVALSNMNERMKAYALKMAELSDENQELIIQMIDKLQDKKGE